MLSRRHKRLPRIATKRAELLKKLSRHRTLRELDATLQPSDRSKRWAIERQVFAMVQVSDRSHSVRGWRARQPASELKARISIPDYDQPSRARFAAPGLTRTAEHLPHARSPLVAWKRLETLRHRIETLDRVRGPVGRPHAILVVDINGVGAGGVLRHHIDLPTLCRGIVATDAAAVPQAHPQHALGIRPDAPRPHAFARRLDHGYGAGRAIDLADIVAGERREPNIAGWGRGDAVAAR